LKLEKIIKKNKKLSFEGRKKVIFQKNNFNLKYHQFCRKECSGLNQSAGPAKINKICEKIM